MCITTEFTNDTQDYVCSITPEEFEVFCMEVLRDYADKKGLENFIIEHDAKIKAYDGVYQIDVYATFTAINLNFKILCECKQHSSKVKRSDVQVLNEKIRSLGAHKGVLLSTQGFQAGTINYASKHGIDLIQVFDHSCVVVSHAAGPNSVIDENDPFYYLEKHWPKYGAICFSSDEDDPFTVYPTKEMVQQLYKEQSKRMKAMYGFELELSEEQGSIGEYNNE